MVKKTLRRNGDPYNGDPASHITSCQKRIEEVLISGLKLQVLTCHSNLQNWKGKKSPNPTFVIEKTNDQAVHGAKTQTN